MTPIATPDRLDLDLGVVLPIFLAVVVLVVVAVGLRSVLMTTADELADLWRTYGPVALARSLDMRPGLSRSPWFCSTCASYNGIAARRCYRCAGRREECEAPVPDADTPAGGSAGLSQRTRREG